MEVVREKHETECRFFTINSPWSGAGTNTELRRENPASDSLVLDLASCNARHYFPIKVEFIYLKYQVKEA